MSTKALILLCSTALILTACTSKRGPKNRPPMDPKRLERLYTDFIARWDYNEDGDATCDDIIVQRSRLFKRLDENNDSVLTSREYRHARFEDKSFMFYELDRIDANGSAVVELDEFMAVSHSQFLSMDQNDDCYISKREALAATRKGNPDAGLEKKSNSRRGKGRKQ